MKHLCESGITVYQASSDADTLVVKRGLEASLSGNISAIVGEDTDLLVLMIALTSDIYVYLVIPSNKGRAEQVYSSRKLRESLGDMTNHILFIYALSGWERTNHSTNSREMQVYAA